MLNTIKSTEQIENYYISALNRLQLCTMVVVR
jgi:hypothetical protein